MSADIIQVDFKKLQQVIVQFETQADQTKRVHQRITQHLNPLQNGGWRSQSANRFYQEMNQEILPAIVRLNKALLQGADTTRQIILIMAEADDTAAGYFRFAAVGIIGGGMDFIAKAIAMGDWEQISKVLVGLLKENNKSFLDHFFRETSSDLWGSIIGRNGDDLAKLTGKFRMLDFLDNTQAGKLIKGISPGIVDGLIDYGFDVITGDRAWNDWGNLGVQVTSGMIQAGIAMTGVGAVIIGIDTGVQIGLTGLEFIAAPIADSLGYDGKAFGESISNIRETVSLDGWIDKGVEWVGNGAVDVVEDIGDLFGI